MTDLFHLTPTVSGLPRDPAAALVENNSGLVGAIVARRCGAMTEEDRQDAYAAGLLGLLDAARRYDPARGIAFSSFAYPTILGHLMHHFRTDRRASDAPLLAQAYSLDLSPGDEGGALAEYLADPAPGPDSEVLADLGLDALLALLPERHAWILRAVYVRGYSQTEVAEALGISRARCSQMVQSAMLCLRRGPVPGRSDVT